MFLCVSSVQRESRRERGFARRTPKIRESEALPAERASEALPADITFSSFGGESEAIARCACMALPAEKRYQVTFRSNLTSSFFFCFSL